jgi:hypothetical protein
MTQEGAKDAESERAILGDLRELLRLFRVMKSPTEGAAVSQPPDRGLTDQPPDARMRIRRAVLAFPAQLVFLPFGSMPSVFLILGATGSGRREVVADLIAAGLQASDRPAVMLAESEPADPIDATLPGLTRWTPRPDGILDAPLPPEATHVFFLTDGAGNPVDQLEAAKPWLEARGAELARVICVVNTQLASHHPALLARYDACVHFSDIVLMSRREGVDNKWLSGFLAHFRDQYLPCLIELVKDGRVKNPALVLEPQARRLSHYFDEEQDLVFTDSEGEVIDEDDEPTGDDDEEIEAKPEEDPYFERMLGGRRVKQIPDIAKYLAKPGSPA